MKTKIYIYPLLASFLFLGCGSGGGGSSSEIEMEIGKKYDVSIGDRIQRNAPNTILTISHTQNSKTSTVILAEGNATIIKK